MSIQQDPEEIETKYLHNIIDLTNTHVLEIGCGEGRLTWRYAASADTVIGIDINPSRLAMAQGEYPPELPSTVAFTQATTEALPHPSETFDVVILAWSL